MSRKDVRTRHEVARWRRRGRVWKAAHRSALWSLTACHEDALPPPCSPLCLALTCAAVPLWSELFAHCLVTGLPAQGLSLLQALQVTSCKCGSCVALTDSSGFLYPIGRGPAPRVATPGLRAPNVCFPSQSDTHSELLPQKLLLSTGHCASSVCLRLSSPEPHSVRRLWGPRTLAGPA